MSQLSTIMREYFEDEPKRSSSMTILSENRQVPIVPDLIKWKRVSDPERMMRRFKFDTRQRLLDFLSLVFELEGEMNHHGRVVVDHLQVDVEVYTKTVDCITELDIEYTKAVSEIYEDVQHYGY